MKNAYVIKRVLVVGRVQGVGFRAFVEHHALQARVEGWVRNRRDGSVEAVFAGPAGAVDGMVRTCEVGPPSARVDAVDQREAAAAELSLRRPGEVFSCLPTA